MRLLWLGPALMMAAPAFAQSAKTVATDAVLTPIEDIGLKKKQIPAVLLAALESPYSAKDTEDCQHLTTAIAELDAAVGPDHDKQNRRIDKSNVAKAAVGAFIPFRGIIREVSGAAGAERNYTKAFNAGVARRGFLRGLYQTQGCGTGGKVPASRVVVVETFGDPAPEVAAVPVAPPASLPEPAELHSPVLTAAAPASGDASPVQAASAPAETAAVLPAPAEAAPAVQPVSVPAEPSPAPASPPAPAEGSNPA